MKLFSELIKEKKRKKKIIIFKLINKNNKINAYCINHFFFHPFIKNSFHSIK
jgi:hypothetical protein